jgi:hypothetical protein
MHRNPFVAAACAMLMTVIVADARAAAFYYAHPELVDLSRDRNVTSTSSVVADYNWQSYAQFGGSGTYVLNLGSIQAVGKISFAPFPGYGATSWTIDTSNDGTTWTPPVSGGTTSYYVADYSSNPTPFTAQYVRVNLTGQVDPYGDLLDDVRVYGDARVRIEIRDTLNIAGALSNGGTAGGTTGGVGGSNNTATLVDEDPNDGSESANTFGVNVLAGNHLDVTLNDAYLIKGMRWGVQTQYGQVTGYQVYTMMNGVQSLNPIYTSTGAASASQYIDFGASYDATGLRVVVTSTSGQAGFVNEIEVFGSAVPEPAAIGLVAMSGAMLLRRRR